MSSAAEVDEFDFANGTAEEAGTEALELFDGVGGEAMDFSGLGFVDGAAGWARPLIEVGSGFGGSLGGVDDFHSLWNGLLDERP